MTLKVDMMNHQRLNDFVLDLFIEVCVIVLQQFLIFLRDIGPSDLRFPVVCTQSQLIEFRISFPRVPALKKDRRDLADPFCPPILFVVGFVVVHDRDRCVHLIIKQSTQDHIVMQWPPGCPSCLIPPAADILFDCLDLSLVESAGVDIEHRLLAHHQPARGGRLDPEVTPFGFAETDITLRRESCRRRSSCKLRLRPRKGE